MKGMGRSANEWCMDDSRSLRARITNLADVVFRHKHTPSGQVAVNKVPRREVVHG